MTKFIRLTFVAAFFILFCQLGYTAGYLAHDGDERMQPTQHKSKMERVSAGSRIIGSGNLFTEVRDIKSIKAVQLSGFGHLTLLQGKEEKLSITADDNLMPHISSEIDDGHLLLGIKMPDDVVMVQPSKPIEYQLTIKDLNNIRLNGSGKIEANDVLRLEDLELEVNGSGQVSLNLQSKQLETEIAGSGSVEIKGSVEEQEIEIMGSGSYKANELTSEKANVKIMGSGDVHLQVSDFLACKIYGSGSIYYKGTPKLTKKIYGSGTVKQE